MINYLKAIFYQSAKKSHPIYIIITHVILLVLSYALVLVIWDFKLNDALKIILSIYGVLSLHTFLPVFSEYKYMTEEASGLFIALMPIGFIFSFVCPIILINIIKKGRINYR